MGTWSALPAIGLQVVVVGAGAFLLYGSSMRKLLVPERRCRDILLLALAVVLLMTCFPPGTHPWWVPGSRATRLPPFAFILDTRFDTRVLPVFAVNYLV